MPKMKRSERAKLPDGAFAYIDSTGKRRLPIHDEAHVRNALARFDRVAFEDDPARERARKRLLVAAKRYGIVPVGFIDGQLRSERGRPANRGSLPTGVVTFLLTDIQGSTELLQQIGDRYGGLLRDIRSLVRREVRRAGGHEVDVRADEFFGVFERTIPAIQAGIVIQRLLVERRWPPGDVECRLRMGIHTGSPTLTDTGYIGLPVHTAARICSVAHGGQIVLSADAMEAVGLPAPDGFGFVSLGHHRLQGLTARLALYQIQAEGLVAEFPPLRGRTAAARKPSRQPAGAR